MGTRYTAFAEMLVCLLQLLLIGECWMPISKDSGPNLRLLISARCSAVFDELKDLVYDCEVAKNAKVRERLMLRQWLLARLLRNIAAY